MTTAPARPILVGVDGSRDGLIALRWAAGMTGELWVVHVVDDQRSVPSAVAGSEPDDGTEILDDAAHELERVGHGSATTFEVRHGRPAETLLELSSTASLLVIGRRGLGGFAELLAGSTSQVCAALARVPLVVVPDQWSPDAPAQQRVVVGVDGSPGCQAALAFGFDIAARRGAELAAVHALPVPEPYPPPTIWIDPDPAPWTAQADAVIDGSLSGWQDKYPDVTVTTRSTGCHPVQLLALESARADLVVVGGFGQTHFTELSMGSVARGLLHHSRCPVAVIHSEELSS